MSAARSRVFVRSHWIDPETEAAQLVQRDAADLQVVVGVDTRRAGMHGHLDELDAPQDLPAVLQEGVPADLDVVGVD